MPWQASNTCYETFLGIYYISILQGIIYWVGSKSKPILVSNISPYIKKTLQRRVKWILDGWTSWTYTFLIYCYVLSRPKNKITKFHKMINLGVSHRDSCLQCLLNIAVHCCTLSNFHFHTCCIDLKFERNHVLSFLYKIAIL